MPTTTFKKRSLSISLFVAWQLSLLAGGAAWAGLRLASVESRYALPALRETPLVVTPLHDVPVVASDEQLRRVLTKLRPRFNGEKTKVNHVDHALRFWGQPATFSGAEYFASAEAMRRLLTDNRVFMQVYKGKPKPLLIDRGPGVRVRTQEGPATASHVDHTLACLAEVGTPLEYPLITPTRATTYRALVEQSLRDFSLNQVEYEWSALTYALFLPPVRSWTTTDGQEITFDRLARRIMRQEPAQGVCFGNHRLYDLVVFLRIDDQMGILSPAVRNEIVAYLRGMTALLVATQHADGYWGSDWPLATQPGAVEGSSGDLLADRILSTGHALEWWAMAPAELHPPRETLARAGQWLCRTIDELSPEKTLEYYTFLTHAGRALALWRGRWPYEALPDAKVARGHADRPSHAAPNAVSVFNTHPAD